MMSNRVAMLAAVCIAVGGVPAAPARGPSPVVLTGSPVALMCVAVSPDGNLIAAGGPDGDGTTKYARVRVWDLRTRRLKYAKQIGGALDVDAVAFSPDGRTLAVGESGYIVLLHAATGIPVPVEPARVPESPAWGGKLDDFGPDHIEWSPDGKVVIGANAACVAAFDVLHDRLLWEVTSRDQLEFMAVRAGKRPEVAVGTKGKPVRFFELVRGKELPAPPGWKQLGTVYDLNYSPDGKQVLLDSDARQGLCDADTAAPLWSQKLDSPLALSADGNKAACVSGQTICVFDARTGAETAQLSGHTSGVEAIAFTRDGRRLVSAGDDNTIRVWDLAAVMAASPPPSWGIQASLHKLNAAGDDQGESISFSRHDTVCGLLLTVALAAPLAGQKFAWEITRNGKVIERLGRDHAKGFNGAPILPLPIHMGGRAWPKEGGQFICKVYAVGYAAPVAIIPFTWGGEQPAPPTK